MQRLTRFLVVEEEAGEVLRDTQAARGQEELHGRDAIAHWGLQLERERAPRSISPLARILRAEEVDASGVHVVLAHHARRLAVRSVCAAAKVPSRSPLGAQSARRRRVPYEPVVAAKRSPRSLTPSWYRALPALAKSPWRGANGPAVTCRRLSGTGMMKWVSAYPWLSGLSTSLMGMPLTLNSMAWPCSALNPRRNTCSAWHSPPSLAMKMPGASSSRFSAFLRGMIASCPTSITKSLAPYSTLRWYPRTVTSSIFSPCPDCWTGGTGGAAAGPDGAGVGWEDVDGDGTSGGDGAGCGGPGCGGGTPGRGAAAVPGADGARAGAASNRNG